jgi:hypothetical protein
VLSLKARQKWKRDRPASEERSEGDVLIAIRAQAFDGAEQDLRRQPTHGRLERGWRAGVRSQEARGQEVCQLMPEQRIQGLAAIQDIGRTHEQPGCNRVGMSRSLQEMARRRLNGFARNAFECCMWKIELNDVDRPRNVPSGARAGWNDRHNPCTRRSNRD